jgi:transposase InsO family protein
MTTAPAILQQVYDIRADDVEKSKWEIHEELKRQGVFVAHNVIQKVINRHSELKALPHKRHRRAAKKPKQVIVRAVADRQLRDKDLGSLVQMDTKHLFIAGVKFYLFVAVDCKSRYAFVWAYTTASSQNAADFMKRVKAFFPFAIAASIPITVLSTLRTFTLLVLLMN